MDPVRDRYVKGEYKIADVDGPWKSRQMCRLIEMVPDKDTVRTYADVGCGQGAVLVNLRDRLLRSGFNLVKVVGYDISPFPRGLIDRHREIDFRQVDFLDDDESFDVVTLNDVLEHVGAPQEFLSKVGGRARYVAVHVPLEGRLGVLLANQYNYKIADVGHVSFWTPATALNLVTASGLQPLYCRYTKGILAPSSRERWSQLLTLPLRALVVALHPGLAAVTTGGVSLGILCRGKKP